MARNPPAPPPPCAPKAEVGVVDWGILLALLYVFARGGLTCIASCSECVAAGVVVAGVVLAEGGGGGACWKGVSLATCGSALGEGVMTSRCSCVLAC